MSEKNLPILVPAIVSLFVGSLSAFFSYRGAQSEFRSQIVRYSTGEKQASSGDNDRAYAYVYYGESEKFYRIKNISNNDVSIYIYVGKKPRDIKDNNAENQVKGNNTKNQYDIDLAKNESVDIEGKSIIFMPKNTGEVAKVEFILLK